MRLNEEKFGVKPDRSTAAPSAVQVGTLAPSLSRFELSSAKYYGLSPHRRSQTSWTSIASQRHP